MHLKTHGYRQPLSFSLVILAAGTSLLAGCQSDGSTADRAPLSPAAAREIPTFPGAGHFAPAITNPYFNFAPGRTFTYRTETDAGTEINTVVVTDSTKTILDVATTVIRDQVYLNGDLSEDTRDWMAQDLDGNVWYFGEDTKEYDANGQLISTEGSWEAGVNGNPGIIMLADPEIGLRYKQEDSPGVAEDMAKVISLSESVSIDYGDFDNVLKTAEWSLVESGPRDFKFYVSGVGMVLELGGRGSHQERTELISID
jgi:hypothetical protein